VVLAAGLGRRYGGFKQLVPLGPTGELLSDYTLFDAVKAGASRAVFVIRSELESALRRHHARWGDRIDIRYAEQHSKDLPAGRTKPWGTTEAVLATRAVVPGRFVALNADDYYGPEAIVAAAGALSRSESAGPPVVTSVSFRLQETLSPSGPVSRALLEIDQAGWLQQITEVHQARSDASLNQDQPVSMNCWAFPPEAFPLLQRDFSDFLSRESTSLTAECALPESIGRLLNRGLIRVRVLNRGRGWLGVTHPEDVPAVRQALSGKELTIDD
jgi:hypothetical protein